MPRPLPGAGLENPGGGDLRVESATPDAEGCPKRLLEVDQRIQTLGCPSLSPKLGSRPRSV
jgi:hypothetical protein